MRGEKRVHEPSVSTILILYNVIDHFEQEVEAVVGAGIEEQILPGRDVLHKPQKIIAADGLKISNIAGDIREEGNGAEMQTIK